MIPVEYDRQEHATNGDQTKPQVKQKKDWSEWMYSRLGNEE